jgi:hypothetical protein
MSPKTWPASSFRPSSSRSTVSPSAARSSSPKGASSPPGTIQGDGSTFHPAQSGTQRHLDLPRHALGRSESDSGRIAVGQFRAAVRDRPPGKEQLATEGIEGTEFKQHHQPIPTEPSARNDWLEKAAAGPAGHMSRSFSTASASSALPSDHSRKVIAVGAHPARRGRIQWQRSDAVDQIEGVLNRHAHPTQLSPPGTDAPKASRPKAMRCNSFPRYQRSLHSASHERRPAPPPIARRSEASETSLRRRPLSPSSLRRRSHRRRRC